MLNDVKSHEFHDMQYGFVQGRGTQMAIVNTNDIIKYFNHIGTAVFGCSLDAEKAFDAIPHSILLYKCSSVLSDQWWRLMFVWYTNLKALIRWNNELSDEFMLCKGTRQGGLTSPFLFNLMYQELIDGLSKENGGMRVGKFSYNVFCYADDLLLTSSTVTGLQSLINFAYMSLSMAYRSMQQNQIVLHLVNVICSLTQCGLSIIVILIMLIS